MSIVNRNRPITVGLPFLGRALNPQMRSRMMQYRNRMYGRQSILGRTRMARGRTRTSVQYTRGRTGLGTLGGSNADQRMVYRKKSMPRRKKRRWRSFVRRCNAVAERTLGTRTVLFNDQITILSNVPENQVCLTTALYSMQNASSKPWLRDLEQIQGLENTGDQTATLGETVDDTTKFMFHSGIMDLTIRNTSFFLEGEIQRLDANAQVELDIYEVYLRSSSSRALANNSLSQLLNSYDTKEIGGTGSGISIEDRGATPWELPHNLGTYGVKIAKKTKYFIPNGGTITYQVRDPKRHVFQKKWMVDNDGFSKKGVTRVIFMIAKLVPGISIGSGDGQYACRLVVGNTRKYMYKVEGMNDSRERLITSTSNPGNPS